MASTRARSGASGARPFRVDRGFRHAAGVVVADLAQLRARTAGLAASSRMSLQDRVVAVLQLVEAAVARLIGGRRMLWRSSRRRRTDRSRRTGWRSGRATPRSMPERLTIICGMTGSCACEPLIAGDHEDGERDGDYRERSAACHHSSPTKMLSVYPSDRASRPWCWRTAPAADSRAGSWSRPAKAFAARGITVATFDFPYMAAGRSVPDKGPVLEAHWRTVIDEARAHPAFAGAAALHRREVDGRADRVAGRGAARRGHRRPGVSRLSAASAGQARAAPRRHLPDITEPMLFVQGTRDLFGTADEIRELLPRLNPRSDTVRGPRRRSLVQGPREGHRQEAGRGADRDFRHGRGVREDMRELNVPVTTHGRVLIDDAGQASAAQNRSSAATATLRTPTR